MRKKQPNQGALLERQSRLPPLAVSLCTGTLDKCEEALEQSQAELQVLLNGTIPSIDQDLVRVTDESKSFCAYREKGICFMTQAKAIEYCFTQGKHLPTAREWAVFATSKMKPGAGGLIEIKEYDQLVRDGKDVSGYYNYIGKNPGSKIDDSFYFNYIGYNKESGDLGKLFFWSSTDFTSNPNSGFNFHGTDGYIGSDYFGNSNAVRCAAGRSR